MNLGEESRYGLPAVLINTGTLPLVYSVLEDLPRGVVFNPATRFLEATPTRLQEEQDYTLQAKDSARPQRTDTLNFAIEVVRPRPGLVTNLISTPARGNWSIVWQAPLNAVPAAVDGYDAQYREIGTIPWISLEPSIFFIFFFTVSVIGIDETTNYESRVRAKSSRTGLVGKWSMIETLFIILAPLPTALGMDGISYDGVRLYWTAPTTHTARVRGYRVEWRAVGNSTWSGTNLTGLATTEYTPTLASETTYQWRVRSWAPHGFTDSAWVEGSNFTTLVAPNQPPTIRIIGPSTVTGGSTAQISATASDVDGTIVSYSWSVDGGTVLGSLALAVFTAPAANQLSDEIYTISCTVTDDDGETATATHEVTVPMQAANQAPTVEISGPTSVSSGNTGSFSAAASDPDGTIASYVWSADGGTINASGNPSLASWQAPAASQLSDETYTITCTVTDNDGVTATDTHTVTVPMQAIVTEYTPYYYRRSATTPSTPSAGTGTPSGWTSTALSATRTQNVYRTRGSRTGSSGNYTFSSPSLYASATGITPTEYTPYYYIRGSSTPSTPSPRTGPPPGWATSNPGATTSSNVYRTRGSRQGSSGVYTFSTPTIYRNKVVPEQTIGPYYRRASSRPGTPNSGASVPQGWSSSNPGSTSSSDVWRTTGRRQGSSGNYSFDTPTIHEHRTPATEYTPYYYIRGSSTPSTPSPRTGPPPGWATSNPGATTSSNVYRTRGSRQGSSGVYTFATPSIYRNKVLPTEYTSYYYRRSATTPSTPSAGTGTPSGWTSTVLSATRTQNVYRTRGSRQGSSGNYTFATPTIYRNKVLPTEYTPYYYIRGSSTPSTPAAGTGTPSGWTSTVLSATTTNNVYRTRGSRQGSSGNYTFATPSLYRSKVVPEETIGPYYRRASSRPSTPSSGSGSPSGWFTSSPGATSSSDVWTTTGRRQGSSGSYSFDRPSIHQNRVEPTEYTPYYYIRGSSTPSTPSPRTGPPPGWATSNPGATTSSNVYRTRGSRQGSSGVYTFATPSIYRNKVLPTEYTSYYYRRSATTPSTPSAGTGTPSGWTSTVLSATRTQNVYRTRGSRQGSSGNYTFATPTIYRNKVLPTEYTPYYYRRSATTPSTPSAGTGTPSGWTSTVLSATRTQNVYRTRGSRQGSSGNYTFVTPTIYQRRFVTIGPFYQQAFSQPSTPNRQTSSSAPSGWSSTKPGAVSAATWTTTGKKQGSDIYYYFDTPSVTS